MGKIVRKRKEFSGSSNSAENIMYDATKNVKEAIDETKTDINTLNSNLEWKFLGETVGTAKITLPTLFNELHIILNDTFTFHIIKNDFVDGETNFANGYYQSSSYSCRCEIRSEDNGASIFISLFQLNGSNKTSTAKMRVYYR